MSAHGQQPGTTPAPVLRPGSLSGGDQPRLQAAGLLLRPWERADAPVLVRAYADPDVHRWHARSLTAAQAEAWVEHEAERWQQERGGGWAVTRDGVVLGRTALSGVVLQEARATVSYWVLPEHRGRGVAPVALGALVDWAFDAAGLHRLELDHSTRNPASCRVATKAGFLAEGTKRAHARHLDGWHDMHAHALLADDLSRPRNAGHARSALPDAAAGWDRSPQTPAP